MTAKTGRLREVAFTPHTPRLSAVQATRLRGLEECAERWQKKTGQYACKGCLTLEYCAEAWGKICGDGYAEEETDEML